MHAQLSVLLPRELRYVGVAAVAAAEELAPDLGRDLRVRLRAQQRLERILLLGGDLRLVVLRKRKQALLPQQRGRILRLLETDKVLDELVDHAIRQRVLLEEERAEEERVGAGEAHLGELEDGDGGVQHRHRDLGQHGAHDQRLLERRGAFPEGEQHAFEEGGWLEDRLLDCVVQMEVELPVAADVVLHIGQQDEVEEALRHLGVHVRREQLCRLARRCGRPQLGLRDVEHLLPVGEARHNLKRLRQLARFIRLE
mmetsp:Transcript_26540/g.61951  ORF Transcript_26540/g.61951 Transcript_26540/m.61951 type:complete len:255 (-) Transcript_26540:632-1396(-)